MGPGIFQSFVDTAFGTLRGKDGEECCSLLIDDVAISIGGYEGDTDDTSIGRHIEHLL